MKHLITFLTIISAWAVCTVAGAAKTDSNSRGLTHAEALALIHSDTLSQQLCLRYPEVLEVLNEKAPRDSMQQYVLRALVNMAWVEMDENNPEMGKLLFEKARQLCTDTTTHVYLEIESGLGAYAMLKGRYTEAERIVARQKDYHLSIGDTAFYLRDLCNMGTIMHRRGNATAAYDYYSKAMQTAREGNYQMMQCFILHYMINLREENKAKFETMNEILLIAQQNNYTQIICQTYQGIAEYYLRQGDLKEAMHNANLALKYAFIDHNNTNQMLSHTLKSKVFAAQKDYPMAYSELQQVVKLKDEIVQHNELVQYRLNTCAEQLLGWCNYNVEMKDGVPYVKPVRQSNNWTTLLLLLTVAIVAIALALRHWLQGVKLREQVKLLEARPEVEELERKTQRLQQQTVQTTRELGEAQLQISAKEKQCSAMSAQIERLTGSLGTAQNAISYLSLFYNNQSVLLTKIRNLIRQCYGQDPKQNAELRKISSFISDNTLEPKPVAYAEETEKLLNDFIEKLEKLSPDLTAMEKQLATYIHLGLSTREICIITGNQQKSVSMGRYRLRKSLGLLPETNLDHYLQNI